MTKHRTPVSAGTRAGGEGAAPAESTQMFTPAGAVILAIPAPGDSCGGGGG